MAVLFILFTLPVQSYHTSLHMDTINTIFPRYENSPGEQLLFTELMTLLQDYGAEPQLVPINLEMQPSGSSNIEVMITGSQPELGTLIFAVPINHPFRTDRDNDYSAGISIALSIVRSALSEKIERSVKVLFLGGEFPVPESMDKSEEMILQSEETEQPGPDGYGFEPRGSKAFLATFFPQESVCFIYLDIPAWPDSLAIIPAGSGVPSPSWLYRELEHALKEASIPSFYSASRTLLNRLDLQDTPSPIDPYLKAGYSAITLRGEAGTTDPLDQEKINTFIRHLTHEEAIPEYMDNYYLIIEGKEGALVVSERNFLLILLLVFAAAIAYPVIATSRFRKYRKTLMRHLWSLPLLIFFMFIFLFAATLALRLITEIRNIDQLWRMYPFTMLWFKIAIAALFFLVSQRFFSLLPFSKRGSFYSAAALFFLFADIIVVSFFDINLTAYLVLSFIFVFLFTISRHRMLKVLFFLLSFIPMITVLYGLFAVPAYQAIEYLLLSPLEGNLIIAIHLLPYLLMLIRLRYLFHHPSKKMRHLVTIGMELVFLAVSLFFGSRLLWDQVYSEKRKQPLLILQEINREREPELKLSLQSTAPLGKTAFTPEGTTEKSIERFYPLEQSALDIDIGTEDFLRRKSYTLTIAGEGTISALNIQIAGNQAFTILDANRSWVDSQDFQSARFAIEQFPRIPFTLEFTLPLDYKGRVEVMAQFAEPPSPFIQSEESRFSQRTLYRYRYSTALR
jgi:hypothetical protein